MYGTKTHVFNFLNRIKNIRKKMWNRFRKPSTFHHIIKMDKKKLTCDPQAELIAPDLSLNSSTPKSKHVRKISPSSMAPSPKLESLYHETKYDEAKWTNYTFNVVFFLCMWVYYVFCVASHSLNKMLLVTVFSGAYVSDFASACLHIYLDHR